MVFRGGLDLQTGMPTAFPPPPGGFGACEVGIVVSVAATAEVVHLESGRETGEQVPHVPGRVPQDQNRASWIREPGMQIMQNVIPPAEQIRTWNSSVALLRWQVGRRGKAR